MSRLLCVAALLCSSLNLLATDHEGLEHVNFPLNSHVVVDAFQGLDLLAEVMVKYPDLTLEVVGFTDDISTESYNQKLSERRANSVKAYLESRGVQGDKVSVVGRGENMFVAPNENREGRFQNRRVELLLYEMVDGHRQLVTYKRLIELFFDGYPEGQTVVAGVASQHDAIMEKLSDLEKRQQALQDALDKKLEMSSAPAPVAASTDEHGQRTWTQSHVSGQLQFAGFSGVSFDLGMDENDDFTGRVAGQYFKAVTESFGVQAQGEYTYYDTLQEGQFDAALVYQVGHFKAGAAGSYKFIDLDGFMSAGVGQGALILNLAFDRGHIGAFGTAAFDEGDIIATERIGFSVLEETYVDVVSQYGLNFGINIGEKASLSGSLSKLDTDYDADLGANLRFDLNVRDNLTWYIDLAMNENLIGDEDSERYATGLRLGTWGQANHMAGDQVTPIQIPRIRYEIATRTTRIGNTAPVADAGSSQNDVPEGMVTLDGSASFDPEEDALTYRWTQLDGPMVEIDGVDQATATFMGVAGEAYTFMLTVRDTYGASGSDIVRVFMEDAPVEIHEPMISFFTAYPAEITEGELVTLTWSTMYADTVTISEIGQVPTEGDFVMSPMESVVLTLTASSDVGTVSDTVTITVNPIIIEEEEPNTPPVAHAGPDQFRHLPGTVMLDGSASFDPDDDALTYQWVQISGKPVDLAAGNTPQPTFDSEISSAYIFRLIVSDGNGGIDTDDVLVQVF